VSGGAATAAGERSVAIGGDVRDTIIVTGDNNTFRLEVGADDGALLQRLGLFARRRRERRRPPGGAPPPPFEHHVDREDEVAAIRGAEGDLNVHGERGIGKTCAVRETIAQVAGDVVWLDAKGLAVDDVLQDLFRAFWDCEPPQVVVGTELRDALRDCDALVVADALDASEDDVQRLITAAPRLRFVITSRERMLWGGDAIEVPGLALPDALRIAEQELGRPLGADERASAEEAWRSTGGNPLRLRQAMAGGPRPGADDERRVVEALALFGEAAVGVERLAAVTGVENVEAVLERLQARHVVTSHSPRWSLLVEAKPAPAAAADAEYSRWAATARPEELIAEERAILALVRRGDALPLARAADRSFALSGHWTAWREVLDAALAAAREAGDREGEGWALHQLGTRAACLGQTAVAVQLLEQSLEARDAEVTRQNLKLVRAGGGGPWGRAALGGGLAMVAAVGAAVVIAVAGGDDEPETPSDRVAVATIETTVTEDEKTVDTTTERGGEDEETTDDDGTTVSTPDPVRRLTLRCPAYAERPAQPAGDVPPAAPSTTTTDTESEATTTPSVSPIATVSGAVEQTRTVPIQVTATYGDEAEPRVRADATATEGRWETTLTLEAEGTWRVDAAVAEPDGVTARHCEIISPGPGVP
jgi:hypothetical protein